MLATARVTLRRGRLALVATLSAGAALVGTVAGLFDAARPSSCISNPNELYLRRSPVAPGAWRIDSNTSNTGVPHNGLAAFQLFTVAAETSQQLDPRATVLVMDGPYFAVLGIGLPYGPSRELHNEITGVAVSHTFAQRHFGSGAVARGQPVRLNGVRFDVVAVIPDGCGSLRNDSPPGVFITLDGARRLGLVSDRSFDEARWLRAVVRVAHTNVGRSAVEATSAQEAPEARADYVRLEETLMSPEAALRLEAVGLVLWLVAGAAVLLSYVSGAALGIFSADLWTHERFVRGALGARFIDLVGGETLAAAACGAVSTAVALPGIAVGRMALRSLAQVGVLPVAIELSPDSRSVWAATLTACVGSLVYSIARLAASHGVPTSSSYGRGTAVVSISRQRWTVSAVTGGAVCIVAASASVASTLGRSAVALRDGDVGMPLAEMAEVELHQYGGAVSPEEVAAALTRSPVVTSVAQSSLPLLGEFGFVRRVTLADRPVTRDVQYNHVSPEFFRTVGLRPIDGNIELAAGESGAVINRSLSQVLCPDGGCIGLRLVLDGPGSGEVRIVGVVADAVHRDIRTGPEPFLYLSRESAPKGLPVIVARVKNGPDGIDGSLRQLSATVGRRGTVRWLQQIRNEAAAPITYVAGVAVAAGIWVVVMGGMCIGCVLRAVLTRRRQEWVVRQVVGATPFEATRDVCRDLWLSGVVGIVASAGVAEGASHALSHWVYGVSPSDVLGLVSVTAACAVVCATTITWGVYPLRVSRLSAVIRSDL